MSTIKNGHLPSGSFPEPAPNSMPGAPVGGAEEHEHDITFFELAKDQVLEAGDLKMDESQRSILRELAKTLTQKQKTDSYDPIKNPADRMREREHEQNLEERTEAATSLALAGAARREADEVCASSVVEDPAPRASRLLVWSGTAFIAISIAPTIADAILGGLLPAVIAWAIGGIVGGLGGAMLTQAILEVSDV